jgi:hypothetical protein
LRVAGSSAIVSVMGEATRPGATALSYRPAADSRTDAACGAGNHGDLGSARLRCHPLLALRETPD